MTTNKYEEYNAIEEGTKNYLNEIGVNSYRAIEEGTDSYFRSKFTDEQFEEIVYRAIKDAVTEHLKDYRK